MAASTAPPDPFDDVLNLEEQFHADGYEQGARDGIEAGKIEGRSLGMARGFDKFVESGRLYSKALIWANRTGMASHTDASTPAAAPGASSSSTTTPSPGDASTRCSLPQLSQRNARLEKNVVAVGALVEPDTLSTENTDDAVNDFDDRVKRAQGKAKIIERAIGEQAV